MTSEIVAGKWAEVRQAAASKGLSLSTTAARLPLPLGTQFIQLIGTTYSTAVVARFQFNPWLTILKWDAVAEELTDYSMEAQDGDSDTSVVLSDFTDSDMLLVGSHMPFGGVHCDVDGTNGEAATIDVAYWDGSAWASITPSDGTASGGATLAQDGGVTWTVPADWGQSALDDEIVGVNFPRLYWTRWMVDTPLDSSVTLDHMLSINRSSAYAEIPAGLPWEQGILVGPDGIGNLAALTDAGTALLLVNCAAGRNFL